MIQVLLAFKVDINSQNIAGETPLHNPLFRGTHNDARVARLLTTHGADPNARNIEGFTLLHRAA